MKKGFTIIELMVVIAIIGIITAIGLPRFTGVTASAKAAQVQGNLAGLRTAIEMYYARNDTFPVYSAEAERSTESRGDIDRDGSLSEKFAEFYSKSVMPATPGGRIEAEGVSGTVDETNRVIESRDNTGGWLYLEDEGKIYANLTDGTYTGDITKEIWEEDTVPGDNGGGEGDKPPVPEGPGDWPDFIGGENVHKERSGGYGEIFFQQGDGGSTITPSEWHGDWEKVYLYDGSGNFMPNPETEDGSYRHGEPIPVEDNNTNDYIAVISKTDPESGEIIYLYSEPK